MGNEENLRECKVTEQYNIPGLPRGIKISTKNGLFHCWGKIPLLNEFKEFKDTATVALVEFEDGSIKTVDPNKIQFLE